MTPPESNPSPGTPDIVAHRLGYPHLAATQGRPNPDLSRSLQQRLSNLLLCETISIYVPRVRIEAVLTSKASKPRPACIASIRLYRRRNPSQLVPPNELGLIHEIIISELREIVLSGKVLLR